MHRWRRILVVVVALGLSGHAGATGLGLGLFSRKPKANPAEQVPTLIMQLKTDKDEGKRAAAAEELRQFDAKAFPEIMTVLADALIKDASPAVRSEAASSIARLRPINQQAGFALEQASHNDPALRVRMAAKQALWQYHLVGYRSNRPTDQAAVNNTPAAPRYGPHISAKFPRGESPEPPLADAPQLPPVSLPKKPATQPVAPPRLLTPPAGKTSPKTPSPSGPSLDGPAL